MSCLVEMDPLLGELYLAGQRVPAGTYRQVGGAREVRLETDDVLPGSLDGRVAVYGRAPVTWASINAQHGCDDAGTTAHRSKGRAAR